MTISPEEAERLARALWDDPAHEPPAVSPIGAGSVVGPYTIQSLIATGGMGAVFRARRESASPIVALKVVRPELLCSSAARRFRHEAELLGRLAHPGIAQIFEAGSVRTSLGEQPYFAMEFVEGLPLLKHADDAGLNAHDRVGLLLKVCDAVEHAHRAGVIHRDLKPSNVLVTTRGEPKVLDFGIAKATDADILTNSKHMRAGHLVGTLPYMSPEQASDGPTDLDTRSDVYTLGVLLYQLLCGRLPYEVDKRDIADSLRTICQSPPAPMGRLDHPLQRIEPIVGKALEKDRDRRYQSAADLAADVRGIWNVPVRQGLGVRLARLFGARPPGFVL